VLVAWARRAPGCQDAGRPPTEPSTWPTEDAAARCSGAFGQHSHWFAKPSLKLEASRVERRGPQLGAELVERAQRIVREHVLDHPDLGVVVERDIHVRV
jgi:hypothetical protein